MENGFVWLVGRVLRGINLCGLFDAKSCLYINIAQSAAAVEYVNCISAEGSDSPNECPGYDIKQSDGEAPVMLLLWGMRSTPSLPSFPGLLWPGVVVSDRVLSMGHIELFDI